MKIFLRIVKSLSLIAVSSSLLMFPAYSEAASSDTATVTGLDGVEGTSCTTQEEGHTRVGSLNPKTANYNNFICIGGSWKYDPNGDLYEQWAKSLPRPADLPAWPIQNRCVTRSDIDNLKNTDFGKAVSNTTKFQPYLTPLPRGVLPYVSVKMKNSTTALITVPAIKDFDCSVMMIYLDSVSGLPSCGSDKWLTGKLPAVITCTGLKPRYTYAFYYTIVSTPGSRGNLKQSKPTMVFVNEGKKSPTITFQK